MMLNAVYNECAIDEKRTQVIEAGYQFNSSPMNQIENIFCRQYDPKEMFKNGFL
jgi:hypothetical protein